MRAWWWRWRMRRKFNGPVYDGLARWHRLGHSNVGTEYDPHCPFCRGRKRRSHHAGAPPP